MRRILVAVDGTQASREAARTALEYASGMSSRVTFVHVLPERVAEEAGEAPEFADFERACEQYAEALLKETCANTQSRHPGANTLVAHGEPAAVLSELAEEEDVVLVIVGARARGSLARTLLGSVSGELMCRCPKPVLVVPERAALGLLPRVPGEEPPVC
ncbi:universal stress protein [Hyalangium minutum]|uniref:Universal stress protein UspA n=1 Tax=Hyalangium minutum TaxID=394096 RepID=A0A085WES2_9BACT|nr:universal stress protein [Hyalangium minutum]KFE66185.1 Universal stress protein UspA [Hyalangium minutum]